MAMMKNYFLKLLQQCSEEKFGQDAVEWAIVSGLVRLSYDFERDVREIMSRYDEIIEGYRHSLAPATDGGSMPRAPMERAVPQRKVRAGDLNRPVKKKHAA
jgi:hypothetical protein